MRELLGTIVQHYLRERNLEDTQALLTGPGVISLGTGEPGSGKT